MPDMSSLKDQYQYRKYSKAAEGEKDKNCLHCKNQFVNSLKLMYCRVVKDTVARGFLCDKIERG
jgi:hypothetical protein